MISANCSDEAGGPVGRLGRWTLVASILGLALIGFLQLTRGTAVRHVEGVGADGVPTHVRGIVIDGRIGWIGGFGIDR